MWSLKYSMSNVPMTDWVATKVTIKPAMKAVVRLGDHSTARWAANM
jgi:hypothetical protein